MIDKLKYKIFKATGQFFEIPKHYAWYNYTFECLERNPRFTVTKIND